MAINTGSVIKRGLAIRPRMGPGPGHGSLRGADRLLLASVVGAYFYRE